MDAIKAMDLIENLETRIADMYARLEKMFSDDKNLSRMFGNLHREELNHANMARMQKRIVRSKPSDFGEVDLNFSDFKKVMDHIAVVMGMPKDKVPEILIQCYLIESSMVEQYVVAALRGANEEVRQLLDLLGQGFRDHLTELAARVKALGTDITDLEKIRRHPRVSYSGNVTINEKAYGKCVDISESGLFILTALTLPEGASVQVSFPMSGGTVSARATVRYSVPNAGLGLNFDGLSDQDRALIREYMDKAFERAGLDGEGGVDRTDRSGTA